MDAEDRENRLLRCDQAASLHRYGLLQRGDRWKLMPFDRTYRRPGMVPEQWQACPEWMTLGELERCLGVGERQT
jgi:hypothetical protein